MLAATLVTPASALAEAPKLHLATRVVALGRDAELRGPGTAWVAVGRAVRRDELDAAEQHGVRYLGMAGAGIHAYALADEHAAAWLRDWDVATGFAMIQPSDKLGPALAELQGRAETVVEAGLGLGVSFWPGATTADVRRLVGRTAGARLPTAEDATLGPDSIMRVPAEDAKWLSVPALLADPAVAAVRVLHPLRSLNTASRRLSGSDALATDPYGLTGRNILVGHWDGGEVDVSHPDFENRVTNLESSQPDSHATHTAGTVLGAGVTQTAARGHAPGAGMVAMDFYGNPLAERREVKHAYYHHHDNHSWGADSRSFSNYGTYDQTALEMDVDSRDLLLLPVKAAGNDGQESEVIVDNYGFDSLSPDSTSKNALVVGATRSNGSLAGYSSRGPTEDGRVKPDVVAVGSGVLSTGPGGRYFEAQGTSMSTPAVTGMLALLKELFERGSDGRRMHPDVARGLLIHTAQDEFEPGPDYRYGWGIARSVDAGELIMHDREQARRLIVRGAVRHGEVYERSVEVESGASDLKITLSWLDAFTNATAAKQLIDDLDLVLVSPSGQTFQPWVLSQSQPRVAATTGVNTADNVEQVLVASPEAGTWTVRVTGTSVTDPNLPVQGFVLLSDRPISTNTIRTGPSSAVAADIPDGQGSLDIPFEVTANATVDALRVYLDIRHEARGDVRVTLVHPDGTQVTLETEDTSSRRDLYAIYPDLRSYDDDVAALYGKDASGAWTVRIEDVRSGNLGSLRHAELEIDLGGPANQAPVAVIEGPTLAASLEVLTLSGAGSSDPDGDPLSFSWQQLSGPEARLQGTSLDTLTVTAPEGAAEGEAVVLELTVSDGRGASGTATHTFTLTAPNNAPVPQLSGPSEALVGTTVRFDALASTDPDGDALSFAWAQNSGPTILSATVDGALWTFEVPEAEAGTELGLSLVVSDARGSTVTVPFTLRVLVPDPTTPEPTDGTSGTDLEPTTLTDDGCGCTATETGRGSAALLWGLGLVGLLFARRRR